jgi:hypothetical protein
MKHLKNFENYGLEKKEDIVKRYCKEYPKYKDFFTEFLDFYPSGDDFKNNSYEYQSHFVDNPEEDWSPEGEIYQLEKTIENYPSSDYEIFLDIWIDFSNDMSSSDWDFNNTPLGKDVGKYNL